MTESGRIRSPWFYVALSIVPGLGLIALGKWRELLRLLFYLASLVAIVLLITGGEFEYPVIFFYFALQIQFLYPWQVATASFLIDRGDSNAPRKPIQSFPKPAKVFQFKERSLAKGRHIVRSQVDGEVEHFLSGLRHAFWVFWFWPVQIALAENALVVIDMDYFNIEPFRVIRYPIGNIQNLVYKEGILTDGLQITLLNGMKRKYRISLYSSQAAKSMVTRLKAEIQTEHFP